MATKKTTSDTKGLAEIFNLGKFFDNSNIKFILGIILFFFSVYMMFAFVSFLYTGENDMSILESTVPDLSDKIQNKCGPFGANMAYFFIKSYFGYAAFFIPALICAISLTLVEAFILNIWKWFLSTMLLMLWLSIALAKFAAPFCPDLIFNPGGVHGDEIVRFIEGNIGSPGLIAILAIIAIIYLIYISSETINIIRKILNPSGAIKSGIHSWQAMRAEKHRIEEEERLEKERKAKAEEAERLAKENPNTVNFTTDDKVNDDFVINLPVDDVKEEEKPIVEQPAIDEPIVEKPAVDEPAADDKKEQTTDDGMMDIQVGKEEEKASGNVITREEALNTPINHKEPWTKYQYPTLDLLNTYDNDGPYIDMDEQNENKKRIVEVLDSFGVQINTIKATVGPTITLYEITPAEGVRISKIRNLEDDIALSLAALGIRIIAPIPGKGTIGIEVPNKKQNIVSMESILNSKKFQTTEMALPIALGKTITNEVFMVDLAKMPHLLVAGATGQGKSVGLNALITSLLYKKHPNELKFVLIDPKKVEFSIYSKIANHFLAKVPDNDEEPIITDVTKVVRTLNSLCELMDYRYDMLKIAGVRNIKEYNEKYVAHHLDLRKGHEYMPYIVVVIDEFGDLIMTAGKEIEMPIARIAQLARAVGIHMVIATQRPTTSIITGNIKANFPARIAFKVSAVIDSRTIIDRPGANQLIGRGDMLFLNGTEPVRVQCAFVDTPEVNRINEFISEQPGPVEPMELPEPESDIADVTGDFGDDEFDARFREAAELIVTSQQGSTSMIQRRMALGYNRAGRIMDQMEHLGIVGQSQGSKPREVLITDLNSLDALLKNYNL